MDTTHYVYGTKCASAPFPIIPEKLSEIYQDIIKEHGEVALHKPVPGDSYRKRYTPLSKIDRPTFRKLPEDIIITQPSRLFRSNGWKYKGKLYLEAELYWEFEYKFKFGNEFKFDWLPIRLLSSCYIPTTLSAPTDLIPRIKVCPDPQCDAVYHNVPKKETKCTNCGGRIIEINEETYWKKFAQNWFQYNYVTGDIYRPKKELVQLDLFQ